MAESSFNRRAALGALVVLEHGELEGYLPTVRAAVERDPDFYAHMTAWNRHKGELRDLWVALPTIGLRSGYAPGVLPYERMLWIENAVAHLMRLGPRELVRALKFNRLLTEGHPPIPSRQELVKHGKQKGKVIEHPARPALAPWPVTQGAGNMLESAVERYLRLREANPEHWQRVVVSAREAMLTLYSHFHVHPAGWMADALFEAKYPEDSLLWKVAHLREMAPLEAAALVVQERVPFTVATSGIRDIRDPHVLLALLKGMTGNELLVNTAMLQKLGVMADPVLAKAYQEGLERAASSKKTSTVKAHQAAAAVAGKVDVEVVARMEQVTTVRVQKSASIEGDWAVLIDRSGSMKRAIEAGIRIAAFLASAVKGKVWIVLFNTDANGLDVTGKSLAEIERLVKNTAAIGGTSIGKGLQYLRERKIIVQGIAIVSDGGENTDPYFVAEWPFYSLMLGRQQMDPPTVYFYWLPGEPDALTRSLTSAKVPFDKLSVENTDYYALADLARTMRANRFSLVDEVMSTPLLTLAEVFSSVEVAE